VIFVPIMVFLTICFESFIHGMLLTVVCSVMNFALLNKENAFLFPWAIPSNIYLLQDARVATNPICLIISALIVFTVFLFLSLSAFRKMDVNI
ncbi:MAG: hypothetical protein MJA31_04305, partial [Clostridia bacterium]|nr:hypothetical protein [Clostridia bacterium]